MNPSDFYVDPYFYVDPLTHLYATKKRKIITDIPLFWGD